MQEEAKKIKESLRDVIDFEVGIDVVSMGFIRDVDVQDDQVEITMIFTSPMCPMASMMAQQVEQQAETVTEKDVVVKMGDERWTPDMMEGEAREALGV
jgi:metal-sulfur cluster biosynthetic enzyme